MFLKLVFLLTCSSVFIFSCRSDKAKKDAESKTSAFFLSLKSENETALTKLYPGFKHFDHYYKSDSGKILSTVEANKVITVEVNNRFTNKFGKLSQENIYLYYKIDSLDNAVLFDSKGLSDFEDNDDFIFATKTGCVDPKTDTTDQQAIKKLKKAKQLMLDKAVSVYLELMTLVRVINWNWESGFGGSASGQGIVRNNSTYSIPKLKYKVVYKDRSGNAIISDDGCVTYEVLGAGESKSFTFYTSYIGGASQASIELIFDEDMIYKYLSSKDWTGNECRAYFADHRDTASNR